MKGKNIAILTVAVLVLVLASLLFGTVYAEGSAVSVTMPAVFKNGMVLQRNKPININGYSESEGAVITAELDGVSGTATVVNGEWCVTLPAMSAARGKTVTVKDSTGRVLKSITDVSIGEVWVMTGQSNAALQSCFLEDIDEYAALADYADIRVYESSTGTALLPDRIGSGTWKRVKGSDLRAKENISALGYVAAAKLAAELGGDVPVALVSAGRGSTKIITWLDYETISEMSPSLKREYDACVEAGVLPEGAHGSKAKATVMYNKVINPLRYYNVAGVMWYQGCGDTDGGYFGDEGNSYTDYFTALEVLFRKVFGGDGELPFYVMQLAPFYSSSYTPDNISAFKAEQYDMCKDLDNTYLVSLANDGNGFTTQDVLAQFFIHPARKSTVGIRTAEMILANEYGIKNNDTYSYPVPISATRASGQVTITFDTSLEYSYGDSVRGFELYDGTKWVKTTGEIIGNTVVIHAAISKSFTKVRYGFGYPTVLMNDGSEIEVASGSASEVTKVATIKTPDGDTVSIPLDTTDVVMTKDSGNITNASGIPLPIFQMTVTAG